MFNTRRMRTADWYLAWSMVILQFAMIGLLVFTGPILPDTWWVGILMGLGVFMGLWAIYTIRLGNLSFLPYVKDGATMVAKGPYKYIRHPMYTGLIFIALALVVGHYTPMRLIFALVLTVALLVKLHLEEEYLKRSFKPYNEYSKRTRKLIPFLY